MLIIELQDKYYDKIKGFVNFHVKNRWIAEDIVQETFLKAHEKIDTLNDKAKARPWLYKIAWNLCCDLFKKDNPFKSDKTDTIPDFKDIQIKLEVEEMGQCVKRKMEKLPDKLKQVISLFEIEEMNHKEISEILDITESTSKKRLQRARQNLKDILERECTFKRDQRNIFICVPREDEKHDRII